MLIAPSAKPLYYEKKNFQRLRIALVCHYSLIAKSLRDHTVWQSIPLGASGLILSFSVQLTQQSQKPQGVNGNCSYLIVVCQVRV